VLRDLSASLATELSPCTSRFRVRDSLVNLGLTGTVSRGVAVLLAVLEEDELGRNEEREPCSCEPCICAAHPHFVRANAEGHVCHGTSSSSSKYPRDPYAPLKRGIYTTSILTKIKRNFSKSLEEKLSFDRDKCKSSSKSSVSKKKRTMSNRTHHTELSFV
jgi:hypothetical protein